MRTNFLGGKNTVLVRKEESRVKKAITAVAIAAFVLLLIASTSSLFGSNASLKSVEVSTGDSNTAFDARKTGNEESLGKNAETRAIDPNASSANLEQTDQKWNVSGGITPPDGRIFLRGEEPYGYLPTCNPKEPRVPILPLDPES